MEFGEVGVFGTAIDLEKAIEGDDFALGGENIRGFVVFDLNGGLFDLSVCHLGGESAVANQGVELLFEVVFAGGDGVDVGRADGLVGLLGGGVFGLKLADLEVVFAVF